VLCILILAFIFLTPQKWFVSKGQRLSLENARVTRLIVDPSNISPPLNEQARLQLVRELSNNKNAEILGWRERRDESGEITAYEIDIR
jgi:hypothetical protein